MTEYKHALLFFCKPPVPGKVKTRLTKERGGLFSETRAAQFFQCSLLDVIELCTWAFSDLEAQDAQVLDANPDAPRHSYDIFVSSGPQENQDLMRGVIEQFGPWPREFHYICDSGSCFDDHFDDAFQQIFALGYDTIVSVGGDVPLMPREHISNAFRWLQYFLTESEKGGMVEAPCQECGVSLVGWTKNTPLDHQGVYYNSNGRPALDAYIEKCAENDLPFAHLTPVADIDEMSDLAHAISLAKAVEYASQHMQPGVFVPRHTLAFINALGLHASTPPNDDFDSRDDLDKPVEPKDVDVASSAEGGPEGSAEGGPDGSADSEAE